MRFRSASLLISVSAGVITPFNVAVAQEVIPPQAEELESETVPIQGEIVVTARRRDERLLDVPVAVSVVGGDELASRQLTTVSDIATIVPNLSIAKQASGSGVSLSIRGIGSTFNDPGIEQTVSFNIDGVPLTRGFLASVAFFDVAQVEVLKGPQALFFGKNSPAGVVSITSNNPRFDLEGQLRAGYEINARQRYVEGIVSGPITPTLGGRLALRFDEADGFVRNVAQPIANPFEPQYPLPGGSGRVPGDRTITGRATLLWEPGTNFSANFKFLANHYEDDGLVNGIQPVRCGSGAALTISGVVDPFGDCGPNDRTSTGNVPAQIAALVPGGRPRNYSNIDAYLATLNLSYDFGDLGLTSVTGFNSNDLKSFGPFDVTVFARIPALVTESGTIFTQEVRVNSDFAGALNFAAGAYYEHSDRDVGVIGRVFNAPIDPANGLSYTTDKRGSIETSAISVFGQLIWDVTPTIEVAGGVRFTHEEKDTANVNAYVNPASTATYRPQGSVLTDEFSDDNVSPEVTLTWRPLPTLTAYAAYKTGYKAGGASIPVSLLASTSSISFGPEKTKGGEIGLKGELLNRRLAFSSAMYSYNLTGLQLARVETVGGAVASIISNAGSARTRGAEIEATLRASENVTLRGSASYNDAKLIEFTNAPCYQGQTPALGCANGVQDRSGDRLSKAPQWTLAGGADLNFGLANHMMISASADVNYKSSYLTQDDGAPYASQNGFALFDASLRLKGANNRWEVAVIGRNLSNQYYIITSSPRPGGPPGDLYGPIGRGRSFTLELLTRF